jgi:hypothetical protein
MVLLQIYYEAPWLNILWNKIFLLYSEDANHAAHLLD